MHAYGRKILTCFHTTLVRDVGPCLACGGSWHARSCCSLCVAVALGDDDVKQVAIIEQSGRESSEGRGVGIRGVAKLKKY